ncbi:MAG: restriction endonuclease [Candidatus Bathyarchaeota archaeon]
MVIHVVKASGETELLDIDKVRKSCLRTGASPDTAERIVQKVSKFAYDGISTREIYRKVYQLLVKCERNSALKFRLKDAVMRMGPSGFSFETYVSHILKSYGYRTRTGVILKGASVNHEIDIIAEESSNSGSVKHMVECKYHNASGIYTGLKEVMYTYARLLDLKEGYNKGFCERLDSAWLVTNTKISQEAWKYGEYKGLQLTGWRCPTEKGLEKLIEKKSLYPITILKSVDKNSFRKFSKAGIILLKDLQTLNLKNLSTRIGIPYRKLMKIQEELTKAECLD